jgi:hypothetical protein
MDMESSELSGQNEDRPPIDREFTDRLPPVRNGDDDSGEKEQWPIYTTALAVMMALVLALSTPWGSSLIDLLLHSPQETESRDQHPISPEASKDPGPTIPVVTGDPPQRLQEPGKDASNVTGAGAPHGKDKADVHTATGIDRSQETQETPASRTSGAVNTEAKASFFIILVNGKKTMVAAGETLDIENSDQLFIQDFDTGQRDASRVKINFVGFVGNKIVNDSQDRGYIIEPKDLFKRHSLDRQGRIYRIEATAGNRKIAEMFVQILSAEKTTPSP